MIHEQLTNLQPTIHISSLFPHPPVKQNLWFKLAGLKGEKAWQRAQPKKPR